MDAGQAGADQSVSAVVGFSGHNSRASLPFSGNGQSTRSNCGSPGGRPGGV